jgi:dihydrofolate reductase
MRKVIYVTSLSLDGYIEAFTVDQSWAFPDKELHRHFNDLEQEMGTLLYGRRMYELMVAFWPTADQNPSAPQYVIDYAHIWKSVPKVVFSKTLDSVDWNSRLVKDDARAEVARLKALPGKDLSIGGLTLASDLAAAGLIDEYRLYYVPILLGSGKTAFANLSRGVELQPIEAHTFRSGTVLLRCKPAST